MFFVRATHEMICPICHTNINFLSVRDCLRCKRCKSLLRTNLRNASMKSLVGCAVVAPLLAFWLDNSFGWVYALSSAVISLFVYVLLLPRFLVATDATKGKSFE
jgi:hypothetical protein